MTPEKLEWFANRAPRQAEKMRLDEIRKHPSVQALSDMDREIYLGYRQGETGRAMAERLDLRPDQVSRMLHEIKVRLQYMAEFRRVLEESLEIRARFLKGLLQNPADLPTCLGCGRPFEPYRAEQIYCCPACRYAAKSRRYRKRKSQQG